MGDQLVIKDLSFTYRGCEAPALSGVNLSIERGEFVAVCGHTGCGKSTLLRQIKTQIAPRGEVTGRIRLDGRDVTEYEPGELAAKIGFVFQSPDRQVVCDKVWHELAFGLENLGVPKDAMRLRIAETAGYFGFEEFFQKDVKELSGGQMQLLSLASVMVMKPELMILDEPLAQLDPVTAGEFLNILVRLNKELGITVIISEHRLDEVLPVADRLVVMKKGEIICDDKPEAAGAFLNEIRDSMFCAMPVPMQVFADAGYRGELPLTVGEGRRLLERLCAGKEWTGETASANVRSGKKEYVRNRGGNGGNTALSCKELFFRYERNSRDVLKGATLDVRAGEIFCLMGANGCGKSTLLSVMCRIKKPYRGKVLIDGNDINKYTDRELYRDRLGMLPQDPRTLFVKDTVYEEVYSAASLLRLDMKPEEVTEGLLSLVGLEDVLNRHPYDLSGGQQQKLALAIVLAVRPAVILMDEPTKGMDAGFKREFAKILKDLCAQDIAVFMVSHDTEFCAEYGDKCALMFNGEIMAVSDTHSFFSGNFFYTTAARRMAGTLIPDAVLKDDVTAYVREFLEGTNSGEK